MTTHPNRVKAHGPGGESIDDKLHVIRDLWAAHSDVRKAARRTTAGRFTGLPAGKKLVRRTYGCRDKENVTPKILHACPPDGSVSPWRWTYAHKNLP